MISMGKRASSRVVAAAEVVLVANPPSSRASAVVVVVEAVTSLLHRLTIFSSHSLEVETPSLTFSTTISAVWVEVDNKEANSNRDAKIHSADSVCSMTMMTSSGVASEAASAAGWEAVLCSDKCTQWEVWVEVASNRCRCSQEDRWEAEAPLNQSQRKPSLRMAKG